MSKLYKSIDIVSIFCRTREESTRKISKKKVERDFQAPHPCFKQAKERKGRGVSRLLHVFHQPELCYVASPSYQRSQKVELLLSWSLTKVRHKGRRLEMEVSANYFCYTFYGFMTLRWRIKVIMNILKKLLYY